MHEWIVTWAGSERCVEQMLQLFPEAELVVGVLDTRLRGLNDTTRRARESWLRFLPGSASHHRWFLPLHPLAFASLDTSGYDLVISSSHAFAKAVRVRPSAHHVCYCHSPPRYLYDQAHAYERAGRLSGLVLRAAAPALRAVDRWAARGVGTFIANSAYVAERISRVYDRSATVVHPPVARKVTGETCPPRGDFLLAFGRLVPYKRVDLAISAANRLALPLVVAGDGPERAALERIAGPTVSFRGAVTEREAAELLSSARAVVFCAEEDFGIAPLEANAHGTPVVAYGRGGAAETVVEGETGVLFQKQSEDDVVRAIQLCFAITWDVEKLWTNAEKFSPARYRRELREVIEAL